MSAASSSSADADIDRSTETLSSSLRSEEWEGQLWQALAQEPEARLGRRIIVVPDAATALAVQWACSNATDDDRRSPRCLTARYVVGSGGLGTALVAFARDIDAVAHRQRSTSGELVDRVQGAQWYALAGRAVARPGWPSFVDDTLPVVEDRGQFEPGELSQLLRLIGPGVDDSPDAEALLSRDEVVVLIVVGEQALGEVTTLINGIPRGVMLVTTYDPDRDLDSLTELIGPVGARLGRYPGPPPQDRPNVAYADAPLASDAPADEDRLGVARLALTTTKLLMHEGTGPLCIGVEAPWGKGKSTFLRLVKQQSVALSGSPESIDILPVDFNAWVYDTAEQTWAGLGVEVIAAVERNLTAWQRKRMRYAYAWRYHRAPFLRWMTASVAAVIIAVTVGLLVRFRFDAATTDDPLLTALLLVSPTLVALVAVATAAYRFTKPLSERVHEYLSRPDHASRRGYQNDVVTDLRFTVERARKHLTTSPGRPPRVVVMVDDLDRCSEDTVVEILQAINVVLSQSEVYTLLAMDGGMVRRAVFRHYRDSDEASLPPDYQLTHDFPQEYLEKIVQFSIHLPPTTLAARAAYVRSLFTVPVPAPAPPAEVPGPMGRRAVGGLAVDPTLLVPPSMDALAGGVDSLSVTDTAAEADAMARYHVLLDDNPREIKRVVNVHRFVKLHLYRSEHAPTVEVQRRLVLWVTLCLAEPDAVRMLLNGLGDGDAEEADLLERIPDVFRRRGMRDIPDRLPSSDLPLLIDAANLIQLVGPA